MENLLSPSPGLIIWTLINFVIFFFILKSILNKTLFKRMKERSDKISGDIAEAEKLKAEQIALIKQANDKLSEAHKEMSDLVTKGREQKERMIREASDEAESVKRRKVEEAAREIQQLKENTIKALKVEVATLVIEATSKLIDETLDLEKHQKIIQSSIDKLPKN